MSSGKRAWPALAACLLLFALPASAGAAYGPHGAVYGGRISTNLGRQAQHPFSLALTANGKRIKAFAIYWHTKACTGSGTDFAGGLTAKKTRLQPSGAFSDVFSFWSPTPTTPPRSSTTGSSSRDTPAPGAPRAPTAT